MYISSLGGRLPTGKHQPYHFFQLSPTLAARKNKNVRGYLWALSMTSLNLINIVHYIEGTRAPSRVGSYRVILLYTTTMYMERQTFFFLNAFLPPFHNPPNRVMAPSHRIFTGSMVLTQSPNLMQPLRGQDPHQMI